MLKLLIGQKKELLKENIELLNEITLTQAYTSLYSNATSKLINGELFNFYLYKINKGDIAIKDKDRNKSPKEITLELMGNQSKRFLQKFGWIVIEIASEAQLTIKKLTGNEYSGMTEDEKALAINWLKNQLLALFKTEVKEVTEGGTHSTFMNLNKPDLPAEKIFNELNSKFDLVKNIQLYFLTNSAIEPREKRDLNNVSSFKELADLTAKTLPFYQKKFNIYRTNNVVHTFANGWKIVKLDKSSGNKEDIMHDLRVESTKMKNCLGGEQYGHCTDILAAAEVIFSLRDGDNNPHIDLSLKKGTIDEIKGIQNSAPKKEFMDMLVPWIAKTFDMSQYIEFDEPSIINNKSYQSALAEVFDPKKVAATLSQKTAAATNKRFAIGSIIEIAKDPVLIEKILQTCAILSKTPSEMKAIAADRKWQEKNPDNLINYSETTTFQLLLELFNKPSGITSEILKKAYDILAKPEYVSLDKPTGATIINMLLNSINSSKIPKEIYREITDLIINKGDKYTAAAAMFGDMPTELKIKLIQSPNLPVTEFGLAKTICRAIQHSYTGGSKTKPIPKEVAEQFFEKVIKAKTFKGKSGRDLEFLKSAQKAVEGENPDTRIAKKKGNKTNYTIREEQRKHIKIVIG